MPTFPLYLSTSIYLHLCYMVILNFTRSWDFRFFGVYWVSKSKCIISNNLPTEGSRGKVLNALIFVEAVVHK